MNYDVIVIGLGGMGSAAFFEAARRGYRCLGIDPNGIAHELGSSHGETRLIRQAYFEHPNYVPLLKRAYEHWHARNAESAKPIFHKTGLVIFGQREESELLKNVLSSASLYNIPIDTVGHRQLEKQFPHFSIPETFHGILEPGAGYIDVERAVRLHVDLGLKEKGEVRRENVINWSATKNECSVMTSQGHHYRSNRLIICPGPWAPGLARLPSALKVRRVPLFWFKPKTERFQSGPCYAFDLDEGFFYGFRENNGLVKVAPHIPGEQTSPDKVPEAEASWPFLRIRMRETPYMLRSWTTVVSCLMATLHRPG